MILFQSRVGRGSNRLNYIENDNISKNKRGGITSVLCPRNTTIAGVGKSKQFIEFHKIQINKKREALNVFRRKPGQNNKQNSSLITEGVVNNLFR